MTHRVKYNQYLALYRKSLPTPDLKEEKLIL